MVDNKKSYTAKYIISLLGFVLTIRKTHNQHIRLYVTVNACEAETNQSDGIIIRNTRRNITHSAVRCTSYWCFLRVDGKLSLMILNFSNKNNKRKQNKKQKRKARFVFQPLAIPPIVNNLR